MVNGTLCTMYIRLGYMKFVYSSSKIAELDAMNHANMEKVITIDRTGIGICHAAPLFT